MIRYYDQPMYHYFSKHSHCARYNIFWWCCRMMCALQVQALHLQSTHLAARLLSRHYITASGTPLTLPRRVLLQRDARSGVYSSLGLTRMSGSAPDT